MIIREANIGKFGKLENQKYQFAPQINVIYGANESGKSPLMLLPWCWKNRPIWRSTPP